MVGNSNLALSLIGSSLTSSSTISVSSDARMKNHIASLPSGSENLFDYLDGKSFFYNGDSSTAKSYGFIAQDVLAALQKNAGLQQMILQDSAIYTAMAVNTHLRMSSLFR